MLPVAGSAVILALTMATRSRPRPLAPWRLAVTGVVVLAILAMGSVWSNAFGVGDRWERGLARIERFFNPPPSQAQVPTVVVPASTQPSQTAAPSGEAAVAGTPIPATPAPARSPVDVDLVDDHAATFTSQNTSEMCAVAATQIMLTILGKGTPGAEFQNQIAGRIAEWTSWEDSHDGGWGPAAIASALDAYGASGYQVVAFESHEDAIRHAAIAISETHKPAALLTWWGAHTWVMTGYRASADPTVFDDATITGAYIEDPWYPRISTIWGPSDPPGNFEDATELERNWPFGTDDDGWSRLEGAYPDRDDRFVVVMPTA